jgi:hypothetical protein
MSDFVLRRSGEMMTLCARSERAKKRLARLPQAKGAPEVDRVLLNAAQAHEVLDLLRFEGYEVAGKEVI